MTNPDNVGGLSAGYKQWESAADKATAIGLRLGSHQWWEFIRAELCHAAPAGGDRDPLPTHHCQNGRSDICLAANYDGVCCPDDSCDIDDGVRDPRPDSAPAGSGEVMPMPYGLSCGGVNLWAQDEASIKKARYLFETEGNQQVIIDSLRQEIALLRKLQQGAEHG